MFCVTKKVPKSFNGSLRTLLVITQNSIVSKQTYLVTSNGDLLEVISQYNTIFELNSRPRLRSRIQASSSTHIVQQRCLLLHFISQFFWRPIEFKFSHVCYVMQCWDTPSEKTGIWQLPKLSRAFQHFVFQYTKTATELLQHV